MKLNPDCIRDVLLYLEENLSYNHERQDSIEHNSITMHKISEDLHNRRMENEAKLAHGKAILEEQSRVPKCPTCGNTNIKPITGTERAVSVIGLGLLSKKINKSYKCLNCKYTW